MKTEILEPTPENIRKCAQSIAAGETVAFPTETVYGLGADALQPQAVQKIFTVKGRPSDNPLIVHVHSFAQIDELATDISPAARKLAERFMPGPITLLLKKRNTVPDCVTAGLPTVGVRMPAHAVCRAFLKACDRPVAAPSANTSGLPSPTRAEHVFSDLNGKIAYILNGGACAVGVESTIVDMSGAAPRLLRAGGIAKEEIESVCGCKAETATGGNVALCPGMKYKHYAPRADVLFSAYYGDMANSICARYDALRSANKRPVILCLRKNAVCYGRRRTFDMGVDYEDYARNLFAALRRADDERFDTVLAEGVPSEGIGAAIINRLIKSSGGHII